MLCSLPATARASQASNDIICNPLCTLYSGSTFLLFQPLLPLPFSTWIVIKKVKKRTFLSAHCTISKVKRDLVVNDCKLITLSIKPWKLRRTALKTGTQLGLKGRHVPLHMRA